MSSIDDRLTVSGWHDDTSGGGWCSDSDSLLPTEEADRRSYPWDSSPEPQEVLRGHRGRDEGNPLRLGQATPPGTKSLDRTDGVVSTDRGGAALIQAYLDDKYGKQPDVTDVHQDNRVQPTGLDTTQLRKTLTLPVVMKGKPALVTPVLKGQRHIQLEGWAAGFYRLGATTPVLLDLLNTLNEKWCRPSLDDAEISEIVDKVTRQKVGHTLLPIAKNAIEAELLRIKSATIKHLAVIAGCSEDHARKIVRDLGCREVGKKGKEKLWALPVEAGK